MNGGKMTGLCQAVGQAVFADYVMFIERDFMPASGSARWG